MRSIMTDRATDPFESLVHPRCRFDDLGGPVEGLQSESVHGHQTVERPVEVAGQVVNGLALWFEVVQAFA